MAEFQDDLQQLRNNRKIRTERDIIDILALALRTIDQHTDAAAWIAAAKIRKLDPRVGRYDSDEALQDTFWWLMMHVAARVPHRHPGQALLVSVVADLRTYPEVVGKAGLTHQDFRRCNRHMLTQHKDSLMAWNSLPFLGRVMRDHWDNPTLDNQPELEYQSYTLQQWLNLNSFAARLQAAGLGTWINFPLWELRDGIEEPRPPGPETDTAVSVAAEWIVQCARQILRECLDKYELDDHTKRSLRAGELYKGPPGFCLERWGYWKRRFGELRLDVSHDAAMLVDEAVKVMIDVELELWRKLEPSAQPAALK